MADEARVRKVQERILQTVASMIGRQVKDPRLELVTITDVRVTGDLQHASVFYTVLGDDEQRSRAARAFASAQGLFRSRVGKVLGLRLTPSLEFILDALPESAPRRSAHPTPATPIPIAATTRTTPTRNGRRRRWRAVPTTPAPASS